MDLVKLFTDTDPRSLYVINALLCGLGLLWTWGVPRKKRITAAYFGWLMFWIGTGAYYCFLLAFPSWSFWAKQSGLYLATIALLLSYLAVRLHRVSNTASIIAVLIVVCSVIADIYLVDNNFHAVTHQILTAVSLGLWAWHLRLIDSSKSIFLLSYALIQLPIFQVMHLVGIEQNRPFSAYLVVTFSLYAALKLALIPVGCLAVQQYSE